jgi:carboxypeptidase C (cathepsin A)
MNKDKLCTPRQRKRKASKKESTAKKKKTTKTTKITISTENEVYCRNAIDFGGVTVFASKIIPTTSPEEEVIPETRPPTYENVSTTPEWINEVDSKEKGKQLRKILNQEIIKKRKLCFDKDIVCWHCTYSFENCPIAVPVHVRHKKFLCHGYFCSWECGKKYLLESNLTQKSQFVDFLNQMVRKAYNNRQIRITPAPSKYELKKFGGKLTIVDFRVKNRETINQSSVLFTEKTPCIEIF